MQRKYILPLFLIFQILFLKIIAFFPEKVEHFYSKELYVYISKILRTVFGKIPFSFGDCIYGILILLIIKWFWKIRKTWKFSCKDNFLKVLSLISVFYFFFHILWALNYYRVPLFEKMNIQREYTDDELFVFTEKLLTKTNEIQLQITHNPKLKVTNPENQDQIFVSSLNGYVNLAKQYPFFNYEISSRKKSLFSLPLTYMGFSGYLNPFTSEAQVNDKIPTFDFPFVVCHEMAHQIGYGSESECNFIGFLACIKNDNLYAQYAAYNSALHYCLFAVAMKNEAKFEDFKTRINPGIIVNYKESEMFWKQYDTFIDKGFHAFYDQFLKMNQQKDGIEGYSKFVNLLVNYYGKEKNF